MSKSCQGLLKDFVKCLRESDCMKVGRAVTAANWGFTVPLGRLAGWGLGWVSARAWSHRPGPCQTWQTLLDPPASQVEKKDVKTCAQEVEECAGLRYAYFSCKRGQLDARTRLRGNKGY